MGKSTIVKLVALQLLKTNDYHILPIMCPKDIVKYFDPNIKQIYIIDDICGKFSVDQSMVNSWERVNRQILKYRKDNKEFRVLGTCRLEISISSPFRKLQEKYEITECNLLQKKFLYSKEEKLKIAACHIDEETIKQLDDKILNAYNMFPLLCMMYAASESNPGVRFFEYPLQAIEEQLDKMQEQNECCFIGLALIVIYNNKLCKLLLQNRHDQQFEDVFNDVFEDLGLVNRPSKRSVLSGLQAQEGIYTKELESTITVIHDKFFDILSLFFGKRIPKTILTHGSGNFIAERFLFESIEEDCDDLKIVLPSELEHSYFNRMVEEIENNRFYNVFGNVQVRNELYQRKFISFLSKHQSIIQNLLYNKWPLYLSAVSGCKLLVQFILNEKRTNGMCNKLDKDGNHQDMLKDKPESDMYACSSDSDTNSKSKNKWDFSRLRNFNDKKDDKHTTEEDACRIQFENSPMVAACEGGYIDIVECLVKYGYYIDHSDTDLPTPLFSACKYGSKDVVDFLLKRNCQVDAYDESGMTALHAACKNGNIDIVSSLLKCNSSMNLCDNMGYTPLYIACRNGHTDVVQILLDNNCDILDDAIHGACGGGYKDIVKILIKHNVDINQCSDVFRATPIVCACHNGHTDVVKLLLDNNCDVLDNDGFSYALHYACLGGFVDIVDLLLRNNCNINQWNTSHATPIVFACRYGHTDVVKLLLDNNCDVLDNDGFSGALNSACLGGVVDIVDLLLRNNCNINQCNTSHDTPIVCACRYGRTDVVKLLLDNNCDVLDNNGFSLALHYACEGGFVDIVDLLLRNNCNINQRNTSHDTPIVCACLHGHTDVVKLLLDNNCDVLDNDGFSGALHYACEGGVVDIVDLLLRNNCNINQCNTSHTTPIVCACRYGHTDVVKLLLDNNCDVLDNDGFSYALHYTCLGGVVDIVDLLLRNNCNINQCNTSHDTPIVCACLRGHTDVVKLLLDNNCDVLDNDGFSGALHVACLGGFVDLVDLLLRNNCNINQCNTFHATPIVCACLNGRTDVVKLLIDNNCDVFDNDGFSLVLHSACEGGVVDIVDLLLR